MTLKLNNYHFIPIRDLVMFPSMIIPVFIGRDRSIEALNVSLENDHKVFVASQKDPSIEEPENNDIYTMGCVCKVVQILRLADGTCKVLLEGLTRGEVKSFNHLGNHTEVEVKEIHENDYIDSEYESYRRLLVSQLDKLAKYGDFLTDDVVHSLSNIDSCVTLADLITVHIPVSHENRQKVLSELNLKARLEIVLSLMSKELEWLHIDRKIQQKVKDRIATDQRDYVKREKLKALKAELGEGGQDPFEAESIELENKINQANMPKEAYEKVASEFKKLKYMSMMSAEASVIRSYIDSMLEIPWSKMSELQNSLKEAAKILDEDHYGLEKVKDRILEALAVQSRKNKVQGNIICLVGPPGVGKTSLGKSVAKAMGREFVRISLGGVRDESEIRGHRKTYIGAMPGKIIKALKSAKTMNPLILLDEIDKMGMDYRGDPASAMLEVLDPSQNSTFVDNYIEAPTDLSNVMFMSTANTLDIPDPLVDRMEIIQVAGYTEQEKLNIAKSHLMNKILDQNGLTTKEFKLSDRIILQIIRYYTREAGVRELERLLSTISRKLLRHHLESEDSIAKVTLKNLSDYLGVEKYDVGLMYKRNQVGVVQGLSWTSVGGDLLTIESLVLPGKGDLVYTGSLGDVMQESIQAAMSVVRKFTQVSKVKKDYYSKNDFHLHVPEGATPKDGPSAGVSICTSLLSVVTNIPIRRDVAMTGEITLRGDVLPIGGLKEKLLAAVRGGIKTVVIPYENKKDLADIKDDELNQIEIIPVKKIDEVFSIALTRDL